MSNCDHRWRLYSGPSEATVYANPEDLTWAPGTTLDPRQLLVVQERVKVADWYCERCRMFDRTREVLYRTAEKP